MLNKIFIIITAIFSLPQGILEANSENDLYYFLFAFSNFSYKQTNMVKSRDNLYNISLSFKSDNNDKIIVDDDSIYAVKRKYGFEALKFGLTKKSYNKELPSAYYFDFSLLKAESFSNITKKLIMSGGISLISKETQIYSKNDIDWLSLSASFGCDLSCLNNRIFIYPTVSFRFGARQFEFDTINFSNFSQLKKTKQWNYADLGVNLFASYNDFSIKYELNTGAFSSGLMYSNLLQLSYELQTSLFNVLSIFVNYRTDKIEISKSNNNTNDIIINSIKTINFGIAIHPIVFITGIPN